MSRHDYSVFPPRGWKFVVALHGNEFHHGLNCEETPKGASARKTGWEGICEGTCWEDLCMWVSHTTGQAAPLLSWECKSVTGSHFLVGVIQHNPKQAFVCFLRITMLKPKPGYCIWGGDNLSSNWNKAVPSRAKASVCIQCILTFEDRGSRPETRKLRRARWRLRKGHGMEKVSHMWPRIECPSRCISSYQLHEESEVILISTAQSSWMDLRQENKK